jgi:hypothetical protein
MLLVMKRGRGWFVEATDASSTQQTEIGAGGVLLSRSDTGTRAHDSQRRALRTVANYMSNNPPQYESILARNLALRKSQLSLFGGGDTTQVQAHARKKPKGGTTLVMQHPRKVKRQVETAPTRLVMRDRSKDPDVPLSVVDARKMAKRARKRGQSMIDGNTERAEQYGNENTPRRARMGAHARQGAREKVEWGQRLVKLAELVEGGQYTPTRFDDWMARQGPHNEALSVRYHVNYRAKQIAEGETKHLRDVTPTVVIRPMSTWGKWEEHKEAVGRYNAGLEALWDKYQPEWHWAPSSFGEGDELPEYMQEHVARGSAEVRDDTDWRGKPLRVWFVKDRRKPISEPTEKMAAEFEALEKRLKAETDRYPDNENRYSKEIRESAAIGHVSAQSATRVAARTERWLEMTDPMTEWAPRAGEGPPDRSRQRESLEMRLERAQAAEATRYKKPEHQRIAGFFATPYPQVERMIDAADIDPGMTVLEPSADTGNIADLLPGDVEITVAEWSPTLRQVLTDKGYTPHSDALDVPGQFDRVIMNPPFEKQQDIKHVMHAFDRNLKPGGRLVAVVSSGAVNNQTGAAPAFQRFVDEHMVDTWRIAPQEWKRSGTAVNAVVLVLDKP